MQKRLSTKGPTQVNPGGVQSAKFKKKNLNLNPTLASLFFTPLVLLSFSASLEGCPSVEGCGAEERALSEAGTSFAVEVERDAEALSPEVGLKALV